jgi:threonine/homoserine/homoserine lactone efflux protein
MLALFLQGLGLGFSASATPGPFQAYLLAQAGRRSLWRSLPLALVPLCADGPIIILVLLVLTRTPDWFIIGLRLVGGFYLLFMAWGVVQLLRRNPQGGVTAAQTGSSGFLKGLMMNFLSPGPYLFWSMVGGPILMEGWAQSPLLAASFASAFYLTLIGGNAALITLFAFMHRLDRRMMLGLNSISALALLAIGLMQIWQGASGVLGLISP